MNRCRLVSLFTALACTGGEDSAPIDQAQCAELDCRDAISLFVLDPAGAPALSFAGSVAPPDAEPIAFTCTGTRSWFEEGLCNEDGSVTLWLYAESLTVLVYEGLDAPSYAGEVTPTWTAPYDSEECGHYCYIAQETVQLLPCEGCG